MSSKISWLSESGRGLHAGQGGAPYGNGVDTVRYRHCDRLVPFHRSGEFPFVGQVGKSPVTVDQGELELSLPSVGLAELAQSPRIGKKFGGGETGLQLAAEGEKSGLRFHDT